MKIHSFDILAPAFIFLGIVLQHFYEDADKQRGRCLKFRAKYLILRCGADDWVKTCRGSNDCDRLENKFELIKDHLQYRITKIHFCVITIAVLLAHNILLAILIFAIYKVWKIDIDYKIFFYAVYFFLSVFTLFLTYAYLSQARISAYILNELNSTIIGYSYHYSSRRDEIMESIREPYDILYKLSNQLIYSFKNCKPFCLFFYSLLPLSLVMTCYLLLISSSIFA